MLSQAAEPWSRTVTARAYSPGVSVGKPGVSSGLSASDPASNAVSIAIDSQARRCFEKLDEILRAAG